MSISARTQQRHWTMVTNVRLPGRAKHTRLMLPELEVFDRILGHFNDQFI